MSKLNDIRSVLAEHEPRLVGRARTPFASVAMILAGASRDPEVLFIERARREGDPWSGHMAFPGGRYEADDLDLRRTAERETSEEVGLDLSGAEHLGRLDDQEGRRAGATGGIFIAGYAYYLPETTPLELSHEVEEALWVPMSTILDPSNLVDYSVEYAPGPFPGIVVGHPERHVVWGLTYRFLRSFLDLLEKS